MLRFSTGLRNGILASSGITEMLLNGVIRIYSGSQPASADTAIQGNLLLQVTVDGGVFVPGAPGNGLNFDAPVSGVLSKAAAEAWNAAGLAAGTAGWFRFVGNADDIGASSAVLPRIDGSVGKTAADLNLSNTTIAIGVPNTIDVFNISMDQG